MTVTSQLTETGGFLYTHRLQLSETQGAAASIRSIEFGYFAGDLGFGFVELEGPDVWANGTGQITANGTLSSRAITAVDADPTDYADHIEARVVYTNGTTDRDLFLSADGPPMPLPPPGTVLTLKGTARDASSNAAIRDVRVEIVSGPGAGRNTKTDRNGKYTLTGAGGGVVTLRASKSGYESVSETMLLLAAKTRDFSLIKLSSSAAGLAPMQAGPGHALPKRLQMEIK